MDTRFKNTDFFIEDIDESVKDLTVNDTSVSHIPANTDFFIENIDNNVIEICTDRGITPSTVSVVPANTDFFIVNIDTNVKKIATDLSITPSSVSKTPANTDFFIENIYFNVILICEELNIEPYEITASPANTDFFIEAIVKNVELIMEAQTEIHVSGTFIHAVLSADSEISDYELEGNATQSGTPTPDAPQPINVVTGEQVVKVVGKNLLDIQNIVKGRVINGAIAGSQYVSALTLGADSFGFTTTLNWAGVSTNDYILIPSDVTHLTFKADSITSESIIDVNATLYDKDKNFITGDWGGQTISSTEKLYDVATKGGGEARYARFTFMARTAGSANIVKPRIELGSQASDYEPYQGQEFEIYLPSDTLDYMIEQGGFTTQGLNGPEQNRIRTKYYIPVEPNTQYTMSLSSWNTSIGSGVPNFSVSYYSTDDYVTPRLSNKDWTAFSTPASFTTPADCHFVRVLFNIGGYLPITPDDMSGIRIRGGNLSTPIELAKIGTYQDRIYKDDGKWYIEKQVGKTVITSDNASEWSLNSTTYAVPAGYCSKANLGWKTGWDTGVAITNRYSEITTYPQIATGKFGTDFQQGNFLIFDSSFTDLNTMRTNLVGTEIYIALATPTTTEITDETLLGELNSIYDTELKEGVINISVTATSPNLPASLKATIIAKE